MSKGPGRTQRTILDALQSGPRIAATLQISGVAPANVRRAILRLEADGAVVAERALIEPPRPRTGAPWDKTWGRYGKWVMLPAHHSDFQTLVAIDPPVEYVQRQWMIREYGITLW